MGRPSGIAGVGAQSHVDAGHVGTTGNGGGGGGDRGPALCSLRSDRPTCLQRKRDGTRDGDSDMGWWVETGVVVKDKIEKREDERKIWLIKA